MEETYLSDNSSELDPEGAIVSSTRRATNAAHVLPVAPRSMKNEKPESPWPVRNLMMKKIDVLLHKPKKPKGHATSDPGPYMPSRSLQSSSDEFLALHGATGEPDIAAMLENPKLSGFVIPWITTEQPQSGTESRARSKSAETVIPKSNNTNATAANVADKIDPGSWSRYSSDGRSGSNVDSPIEEHHETKRIGGAFKSNITNSTSNFPAFYKNSLTNRESPAPTSHDTEDSGEDAARREREFLLYCDPQAIDSLELKGRESTPSMSSIELEFKQQHQRQAASKSKQRPNTLLSLGDPEAPSPKSAAVQFQRTASQRLSSHESEKLLLEYQQKLRDMEKEMEQKRRDLELELEQKLNALTTADSAQQLVTASSSSSLPRSTKNS